ncbi:MAG: hypothetical protein JXA20_16070 [Spirochaetes bacterium]|nr:hypothetical protein [Spirochaetota bacterium]
MEREKRTVSPAPAVNPHWHATPHAKMARSLLKILSPLEFEAILLVLQKGDGIITGKMLMDLVVKSTSEEAPVLLIRDFLVKTGAVSVLFRETIDGADLDRYYVPAISLNEHLHKRVTELLKTELMLHTPHYRNMTAGGINVNYLIRDYSTYLHGGMAYESMKAQIHRGVIIASLYDALLVRRSAADTFLSSYFKDEQRGRYFVVSGEQTRKSEDIEGELKLIVRTMRSYTEQEYLQRLERENRQKAPERDIQDDPSAAWESVYRALARNPATRPMRQMLASTMDEFFKAGGIISSEEFAGYINDLARRYMHSFEIEVLQTLEYRMRIIKIIQYLYQNDLGICQAIRENLEVQEEHRQLVELFIYWVVEISMKIHKDFLNRMITRYSHFYYLFIRSYCAYRGIKNSVALESYFTIVRNLIFIKQSDSRLVKEVLARNP